jgi:hypothetical protein
LASAGADDARFGFLDALAHALLTQGGNFDLTLEALDHIPDLRLDLLLEPGKIGVELLHARVRGQQRRRQLGELRSRRTRCSTNLGTRADFCTSASVSPPPRAVTSRA